MTSILYAFDPSTRCTGEAVFRDGYPIWVGATVAKGLDDMVHRLGSVIDNLRSAFGEGLAVVETPQSYPRDHVPAKDLIKITVVSGVCRAKFLNSVGVFPRVWSHGRPLKVNIERMKRLLAPSDVAKIEAVGKPDVWSAVGIGLHHLGILK